MPCIPRIEFYELPMAADLPVNVAPWTLRADRAVLLVHDMQEFFVRLLPQPLRDRVVDNMVELRAHCREAGIPVVYCAQPGGMTPEQRGLLQDFWGMGMSADATDRDIVTALTPGEEEPVFTKWRYSAFARSDLLAWLRERGRTQLLVSGVYGHVGILMTAVEAFTHDIQPFVVADAIADFSADHHDMTLRYAAERCAAVLSCKEVPT